MENDNIIDVFLHPKSVAVIGASKKFAKGGYRIATNIITNNFKGYRISEPFDCFKNDRILNMAENYYDRYYRQNKK